MPDGDDERGGPVRVEEPCVILEGVFEGGCEDAEEVAAWFDREGDQSAHGGASFQRNVFGTGRLS